MISILNLISSSESHLLRHPQLQRSKQTEHTFGTRQEELGEAGIQLPCCQRLE